MVQRWKALTACYIGLYLAVAGCSNAGGSEKLATWTQALAASQRDGPELIVFKRDGRKLAFVGVQHDSDPASSTHDLIERAIRTLKPRVVIVEGIPTNWGHNPSRLVEIGNQIPDANGLLPDGETVPAVREALALQSLLIGGEPSDAEVRRIASQGGVSDEDLLGFYVLRVVPQWLSQRQVDDLTSDPASELISGQLDRSRKELGLATSVLPTADDWRRWRLSRNRGASQNSIDIKEAGPLADGPWATGRIGAAISKARDSHLLKLTTQELAKRGSVLIVYGGSHALIQLPALEHLMGTPCFRGDDVAAIPPPCVS